MTNTTPALKPCPFCGSSTVVIHEGSTFRWMVASCSECGAQCGEVRVQTLGKGTPEQWDKQARIDAINQWNNRHD